MATKRFTSDDRVLDTFYGDLAEQSLQPLWEMRGLLTAEPDVATLPHHWRATDLYKLAVRAGDLVPIERGGDRRVLAMANPGLGGAPFISSTLWAAVQYLMPGELAPPHRHTPAALRFILDGAGVYTVVDGDAIPMARGDLVLTPAWTFHEHHNPGRESMMWLDVLDLPVVAALDAVFFEPGPADTPAARPPRSNAERFYGQGPGLLPAGPGAPQHTLPQSPLTVYRWADTDNALAAMLEATAAPQATVRFHDPTSGRDVMPTLRCEMTRLSSGHPGAAYRQTGSRVLAVLNGHGVAFVGEHRFEIDPGDIVVVPSWTPCQLQAGAADLDVFTCSDAAVLEALSLFRSEVISPR
jgi:gentisate 1,2-dioxygenase